MFMVLSWWKASVGIYIYFGVWPGYAEQYRVYADIPHMD